MDTSHTGEILKHLEKQNELLMDAYRSMIHELHKCQVEEEMLMQKFYEVMLKQNSNGKNENGDGKNDSSGALVLAPVTEAHISTMEGGCVLHDGEDGDSGASALATATEAHIPTVEGDGVLLGGENGDSGALHMASNELPPSKDGDYESDEGYNYYEDDEDDDDEDCVQ